MSPVDTHTPGERGPCIVCGAPADARCCAGSPVCGSCLDADPLVIRYEGRDIGYVAARATAWWECSGSTSGEWVAGPDPDEAAAEWAKAFAR
ncbi:MAG: hypothetical protein ACRDLV_02380 [Solirubrobacteraceae bacterium]